MNGRGGRQALIELYRAALEAVDPAAGVAAALAEPRISAIVRRGHGVGAFAAGKAAAGMIRGAAGHFSRGLAVLPGGYPGPGLSGVETVFSSHPEPDASSVRAARRALDFFRGFGPEDVILCLISGGASSLLCLPRKGLTLGEKKGRVALLARSGAPIGELNRLRTRLSAVKGGGLGRATKARLVTLVLSDVPGDRPSLVGSGPTIRRRQGDLVRVVGSNAAGLAAAERDAHRRGYRTVAWNRRLTGEAWEAGIRFGLAASRLKPGQALLAGGETTVRLGRRAARGGRSLEFALGAALSIAGLSGVVLLAAGSDGRDGSSPAAGAFADGMTIERARQRGFDPEIARSRHDTHSFFDALGDLLTPGPTGTNVADWAFALRA